MRTSTKLLRAAIYVRVSTDVQAEKGSSLKTQEDSIRRELQNKGWTAVEVYRDLDPAGPYDGKDRDGMYMTSFLQHWIDTVSPVRGVVVDGGWLAVDTTEDLALYRRLHEEGTLGSFCRL